MKYQSPSLVIFAEGKIFFKAAGTFPENDGSTRKDEQQNILSARMQSIKSHYARSAA